MRNGLIVSFLLGFLVVGFSNLSQSGLSAGYPPQYAPPNYNFEWFTWAENSGGNTYGNATFDAWSNNSIAVGCASSVNILGWSDYSEQTLSYIYGYYSTSYLVQTVSYGLYLNYSASGLSDNLSYTLYLNYETIPNSTNDYHSVSTGLKTLQAGITIDNNTPDIEGNISIPTPGGYVCGLTLETSRPLFSGGAFDIGFDYAYTYNATSQQSPLPSASSYAISTDVSYYAVIGFVGIIVVALLIIMKQKIVA